MVQDFVVEIAWVADLVGIVGMELDVDIVACIVVGIV